MVRHNHITRYIGSTLLVVTFIASAVVVSAPVTRALTLQDILGMVTGQNNVTTNPAPQTQPESQPSTPVQQVTPAPSTTAPNTTPAPQSSQPATVVTPPASSTTAPSAGAVAAASPSPTQIPSNGLVSQQSERSVPASNYKSEKISPENRDTLLGISLGIVAIGSSVYALSYQSIRNMLYGAPLA